MKIRQGFISNSSSSSFIIFGIDLDKNKELKDKFYDPDSYSETPKNSSELPKNTLCIEPGSGYGTLIGLNIGGGSTDDGSFGINEFTADELQEYSVAFEKATGKKPRLIGGATYN